ncbi:bifunctional adenosylcobinamide kinase/adenosylcobinamide-phosphate guanylyltransferase [Candidatus Mycobacterium methanotrophicum]|uniref:Bifunctional adenosylcobinamide kinase/adenosylcobinamide-phosphate guanylyltransferase n=1 Tax=Candidatus Mycobacterium methanotrophicum TaxID=2943498 RepID=A0ABY4QH10_9MYCO|nr:bifunctional adenosylcobinamide kinase/adenosylcobinamide-phosphate guanylyltransferase [Candidatus Mycobacterium methanotrophicum]UQX09502.1 bifunctional adenosylcobinamide kinase/adenosylcobinamide-phosphate guanylyltransferase [Candidatus Mycobacterium methanotrophicum]
MRTLALGGIKSGKSRWAEAAVAESLGAGEPVRYLATGSVTDNDPAWVRRIAVHRDRRPRHWSTVESHDIATQLREPPAVPTLIDDVGGWLTAALDRRGWAGGAVSADIDEMLAAVASFRAPLVLVSHEVGLSIVSATVSGRRFTDELGALNQRLAAVCDHVVLMVAGQPLHIKPSRLC